MNCLHLLSSKIMGNFKYSKQAWKCVSAFWIVSHHKRKEVTRIQLVDASITSKHLQWHTTWISKEKKLQQDTPHPKIYVTENTNNANFEKPHCTVKYLCWSPLCLCHSLREGPRAITNPYTVTTGCGVPSHCLWIVLDQ